MIKTWLSMNVKWGIGGTEIKRSNTLNQGGPSNERDFVSDFLCTPAKMYPRQLEPEVLRLGS
jgi:hypothetical protein